VLFEAVVFEVLLFKAPPVFPEVAYLFAWVEACPPELFADFSEMCNFCLLSYYRTLHRSVWY